MWIQNKNTTTTTSRRKIEFNPPKNMKTKKDKKTKEKDNKSIALHKTGQQELGIKDNETLTTLDYFT